ncbi:MAG TPA: hypothetical protein VMA95_15545 [Streptosporangiaceae bacterium]|nr:hypothetical protein [Streptosporangiaceae bacterium]
MIGHVDITPENVVFRAGQAFALIDFDLARPATRVDEMFNAMMWWAPLFDPRDADPLLRTVGHAYLWHDPGGLTLIDTGLPVPRR